MIRFIQAKDGRGPQIVNDLDDAGMEFGERIVRKKDKNGNDQWKVKTKMVFAPDTNAELQNMKQIEEVCVKFVVLLNLYYIFSLFYPHILDNFRRCVRWPGPRTFARLSHSYS